MADQDLIERLAELEHQQWIHWAQSLVAEESGLATERVARWRSSFVAYADLPEHLKDLDRTWARRALALMKQETTP
jgi:hypothetical protein